MNKLTKSKGRKKLEQACQLFDEGKYLAAIDLYRQSAKLGNPHAQVNLANLYDAGIEVTQDRRYAAYLYKLAAKKQMPEAAYNLALSYQQQGKVYWSNYWFRRAAELGDEDAIDLLSTR